ncbi:MAG TPA: hypothetical protein VN947_28575 [Polyangia bacterium]|nr:hypothetical protein [Polyangia bacterium]
MATRSQELRAEAQRTGRAKKHLAPWPEEGRITHNEAHRLDRRSTHALEEPGAHPSRKSTRGSGIVTETDFLEVAREALLGVEPALRARA